MRGAGGGTRRTCRVSARSARPAGSGSRNRRGPSPRTGCRCGAWLPIACGEDTARDHDPHDLVGAFENLMHTDIAEEPLDREIAQVAVAAVELQRLVAHVESGVGG